MLKDKMKYYKGFTNDKGQVKAGTIISELIEISKIKEDFNETDIIQRTQDITMKFFEFLKQNNLLKSYQ